MFIGGFGVTILLLAFMGYGIYEKLAETRQIEAITQIDGLTFEEISELIDKIKQ